MNGHLRRFAMRATCVISVVILLPVGTSCAQSHLSESVENQNELLSLLKAKRYGELDTRLETLVSDYARDYRHERLVDSVFDTFYRAGPELEPLLSEWIAKRPKSYAAYLARGVYYARVGGATRGNQIIAETPSRQRSSMAFYMQKAQSDLDRALSLNNRPVHALAYKMETLMFSGGTPKEIRALRNRALELNPYSLTARSFYITSRLPRWGGSIPEIVSEIEAARPYYAKNPALQVLEGRVDAELGDQALFARQYGRAVEYYTRALQHGSNWYYHFRRGEAYSWAQKYDLSNQDLLFVLRTRPHHSLALYYLGFNYYRTAFDRGDKKYLTEAVTYLSNGIDSDPYDHKALDIRGDAYFTLEKNEFALADFERALALEPNNNEYREDVERAKRALSSKKKP